MPESSLPHIPLPSTPAAQDSPANPGQVPLPAWPSSEKGEPGANYTHLLGGQRWFQIGQGPQTLVPSIGNCTKEAPCHEGQISWESLASLISRASRPSFRVSHTQRWPSPHIT